MLTNRFNGAVMGFAACALFTLGCNNGNTTRVASQPVVSQQVQADHDHASHDHGDHAHGGDSDIAKALASLSAEDRAAAEKQKTCPVTDEPLGAMGAPIKVSVNGRHVFICCEGCKEGLQDDPDKFLAKLPPT